MAGTKQGGPKTAAKLMGISLEEYMAHQAAGEKRCTKCKQWKPLTAFNQDPSGTHGVHSKCKECCYHRLKDGPSQAERAEAKSNGLAWCRGCQAWLPIEQVKRGACKEHWNAEARRRYATDTTYQSERRQHAHARKRDVQPIPTEVQQGLTEAFDGKCAYCGKPATTWDHIIPVTNGGHSRLGNVLPACNSCNSSKKATDIFDWMEKRGLQPSDTLIDYITLLYANG